MLSNWSLVNSLSKISVNMKLMPSHTAACTQLWCVQINCVRKFLLPLSALTLTHSFIPNCHSNNSLWNFHAHLHSLSKIAFYAIAHKNQKIVCQLNILGRVWKSIDHHWERLKCDCNLWLTSVLSFCCSPLYDHTEGDRNYLFQFNWAAQKGVTSVSSLKLLSFSLFVKSHSIVHRTFFSKTLSMKLQQMYLLFFFFLLLTFLQFSTKIIHR
jgi:hypothetical protein